MKSFDLYNIVKNFVIPFFACFAKFSSSFLFLRIVPTSVVLFARSLLTSDALVKKLSTAIFLPYPVYGSAN